MLIRTWNLYHGNSVPPQRRAFLREMVELICADGPDVVCLQEVPLWALDRLADWSGMQGFPVVAARPRLGSVQLGRWITELHHGALRSAFTGQGMAILVARSHEASGQTWAEVSRHREGERRVVQCVRVEGLGLVANFHVTPGLAELQFGRVVQFVDALAGELPVVLAGDANVPSASAPGFSPPLEGSIDQILVRGLDVAEPAHPLGRELEGVVLSDHAPLELSVR